MYSSILVLGFIVGICGFQELPPDDFYELEESDPIQYGRNGCKLEDIIEYITVTELEGLVDMIAQNEHVSPTSLLIKLYRKAKNKQWGKDDDFLNSLEDVAIHELIDFPLDLPPISNHVPAPPVLNPIFQLPSHPPRVNTGKGSEPFLSVLKPTKSHQPPLILPPSVHPKMPLMFPIGDPPPKIPVPDTVPFIPQIRPLRPPPGIIVRINTGKTRLDVPDVIVTVSPMMTIVEALRQAEIKYQRILGLSPDDEVIAFNHSPNVGCFVVSRFDSIVMKKGLMWKITVLDREGKVVYDGVCVPTGREIVMKPSMQISLTYTEIQ